MTADGAPKSLSDITRDMGLNMSDVAAFSGLDESTIFRLWDNVEWLDRISGRSLQCLVSSIPGIAEYAMAHALRKRRDGLVCDLDREGLTVDVSFTGLPGWAKRGEVMFEPPRTVEAAAGAFTDWFGPFEVHVYRFRRE